MDLLKGYRGHGWPSSVLPVTQVTRENGGYRVSGQHSAFASGVGHSSWVIVGGFVPDGVTPYWAFFLIPAGEYKVRETPGAAPPA